MGEGVDGVGDEAGVVAGGDVVVVVGGVGEVFGGQGEQMAGVQVWGAGGVMAATSPGQAGLR